MLIEGCAVQILGLAALALTVACVEAPTALSLALVLDDFRLRPGAGDGAVVERRALATVKPASAGSGSGMYGTTRRSATPPALPPSARCSLRLPPLIRRDTRCLHRLRAFALSIAAMRRIFVVDASRCCVKIKQ